jgi:hypothetical protein
MQPAEHVAGDEATVGERGEACDGPVDLQARDLGGARRVPQPYAVLASGGEAAIRQHHQR